MMKLHTLFSSYLENWTTFWGAGGGPKGVEVTEDIEDTVLPHLTTDNPISTGELSGEPAFNSQVPNPLQL